MAAPTVSHTPTHPSLCNSHRPDNAFRCRSGSCVAAPLPKTTHAYLTFDVERRCCLVTTLCKAQSLCVTRSSSSPILSALFPSVHSTSSMKLGQMVRLVAAAVLAATAVAVSTTPAAVTAAKTPVWKLCPASRCQLQSAYAAKLMATRRALAKQYKVDFTASRTLPVITLIGSARCRSGTKIVQPVHICWKEKPDVAFNKSVMKVRSIIIKAEAVRTGNCAKCPGASFLYEGGCCRTVCNLHRRTEASKRAPYNVLRNCCVKNYLKCQLLKKDVKK